MKYFLERFKVIHIIVCFIFPQEIKECANRFLARVLGHTGRLFNVA